MLILIVVAIILVIMFFEGEYWTSYRQKRFNARRMKNADHRLVYSNWCDEYGADLSKCDSVEKFVDGAEWPIKLCLKCWDRQNIKD